MTEVPTKETLQAALRHYDECINDKRVREREVDAALDHLADLVPHSYISDLLHWGERPRTDEEAIEEALIREQIWREGGHAALVEHLTRQFTSALEGQSLTERQRTYCEKMLRHLWGELQ